MNTLRMISMATMATTCLSLIAQQKQHKPNIIFVISDDHSVPFLGCYGNIDIKTPNLDKFASEGMTFNRAYVTSPQSAPSRSSFFTGRSPISTTMSMFSLPLPKDVITYPDILKENGYYIGVTARSHHQDGLSRNKAIQSAIEDNGMATFGCRFDYHKIGGQPLPELKTFLDKASAEGKGKPFYLQVSFYDPHRPWDKNAIPIPHDPNTIKLPNNYPDNSLIREDFARHYDEIARMDTQFGLMMEELEKRKIKDNTIVIFVGDNGSALLRGKGTLYEMGINVPLIIRWPKNIESGSYSNVLVSGEDFAPTLLELVGCKVDSKMTGHSFAHTLLGKTGNDRNWVFSVRGAHAEDLPVTTKDFDLIRTIVTERYKLIYNPLMKLPYWPVDFSHEPFWIDLVEQNRTGFIQRKWKEMYFSEKPMFELYDLKNDPHELNNLAGLEEYAEIEKQLRDTMAKKMLVDRDYVPLPFYSLTKEYK